MAKRVMCDECLEAFTYNLKKEDIQILEYMKKIRSFNQQLAIDRDRMIKESNSGLTSFKINVSLARLEVTNLLQTVIAGRNKKYYITDDGLKLLEIYKNQLTEKAKEII